MLFGAGMVMGEGHVTDLGGLKASDVEVVRHLEGAV